jgi:hypothetical protein
MTYGRSLVNIQQEEGDIHFRSLCPCQLGSVQRLCE